MTETGPMSIAGRVRTLPGNAWNGPFSAGDRALAQAALEAGEVLFLPRLAFALAAGEERFLAADLAAGHRKNISFDPTRGALGGAKPGPDAAELAALMNRFGDQARTLVAGLIPGYAAHLEIARTSFRPTEVKGRAQTPRHDDRLLHVDAFPSRPMRGRRILRVFSNISPDASPREWRVGGDFSDYARRFLPRIRAPLPGSATIRALFGLTHGKRSAYDSLMLGLHDQGKYDREWQASTARQTVLFPAGSTWLCFTDTVLHAAMAGRGALEQTFHLPVAAMARPELSPLRVLEKLTGRVLA